MRELRWSPRVRRLGLLLHVITSVGWLGAALLFLVLAVNCLATPDERALRAGLLVMAPLVERGLVPLAVAATATGVLQSLGTEWGLIRHWWVIVKLGLTLFALAILLTWTETARAIGVAAAADGASLAALREHAVSPVLHSVGAVVVLISTTVLGIYKPKGLTRRGWNRRHQAGGKDQPVPGRESS